jgi:uncharacterized protein YceH (UPF0502 family)
VKKKAISFVGVLVTLVAFSGVATACDGYYRIEKKEKRYEHLTLNKAQKAKMEALKTKWVAAFKDDHKSGKCDAAHKATVAKYAVEADGVLTAAQRMELKSQEKIKSLEQQVAELKRQVAELKRLIKEVTKK